VRRRKPPTSLFRNVTFYNPDQLSKIDAAVRRVSALLETSNKNVTFPTRLTEDTDSSDDDNAGLDLGDLRQLY
jgi:hypothetical protein